MDNSIIQRQPPHILELIGSTLKQRDMCNFSETCKLAYHATRCLRQELKWKKIGVLTLCETGDLDGVKYLVEYHFPSHEMLMYHWTTKLHDGYGTTTKHNAVVNACQTNNLDIVMYFVTETYSSRVSLLEHWKSNTSYDVDDDHIQRFVALKCACAYGHLRIVHYLVQVCGADLNRWEYMAIRDAAYSEHFHVLKYWVEQMQHDANKQKVHTECLLKIFCLERRVRALTYLVTECNVDVSLVRSALNNDTALPHCIYNNVMLKTYHTAD